MIRQATESDSIKISALATQVFLDTYATEGVSERIARYVVENFRPEDFENRFHTEGRETYLYELEGNLVGLMELHLAVPCPARPACRLEIETLYVSRHFHARGIGRDLLALALDRSRGPSGGKEGEKGTGAGLWLTVNHQNTAAIRFYDKLGFEKIGTDFFDLLGESHENHILWRAPPI
ncbi:GNAT family N-acetyltransferase [Aestuariispira insulae]|uniref:Ribosomal protein S18 acetylase RimI-like enzyme n=1 Tax=Aestuariispira insulae TaxID=1461337 RepID=A0A3D9HKK0_9PROT|nr:GNAT family N-acetyltransferase [Aestuariispira insulae]RED49945.1 ribosomal protein S18 acetylase RimI-like enzyme [Aestuariispira insulae]